MKNERSNNIFLSEGINVLSLFDGMSCGRIALERAGIKVNNYFASEIDKYAIQVTKHNYPNTKHIGDVTQVKGADLPKIDLLIGGSPCQGFSFAGKQLNFDDPRSKLFFEFIRLLEETKPKYFLLENVKMKKEYQDVISKYLGCEPIEISSSKFIPHNRKRLYWTNIEVEQPKQKEWDINDFIDGDGFATQCKLELNPRRVRFEKVNIFNTLTSVYWKGISGSSRPAVSIRESYLHEDREAHRMLTPTECERLQTVPIGYTDCVSKTQRYKMLGNGWTVDVIVHIFNQMTAIADKERGKEKKYYYG